MATSSIFASFDMKDRKAAERFVDALDVSGHTAAWKPLIPVKPPITDKDEIRRLWAKRVQKK